MPCPNTTSSVPNGIPSLAQLMDCNNHSNVAPDTPSTRASAPVPSMAALSAILQEALEAIEDFDLDEMNSGDGVEAFDIPGANSRTAKQ